MLTVWYSAYLKEVSEFRDGWTIFKNEGIESISTEDLRRGLDVENLR
jgi:hypothetical protein